ncbi:hypothetical protein NDU88_009134 [Pleurodeles waltl]|uniref:Uncharacterized protein n=1 Tax=Pleurodeles waltl TaxID=8319 RepID=A0AAV7RY67_PLEWA|nr:hypothetical protein NDU88_009134 [Pleurodeles waltl]
MGCAARPPGSQEMQKPPQATPPSDLSGEQPAEPRQHSQIRGQIKAPGLCDKTPSACGPTREAYSLQPGLHRRGRAATPERHKSCEATVRSDRRAGPGWKAPNSAARQARQPQRGPGAAQLLMPQARLVRETGPKKPAAQDRPAAHSGTAAETDGGTEVPGVPRGGTNEIRPLNEEK